MNLLFLSNSRFVNKPFKDPSTRYRCYHFAEDLIQLGHLADVAHIESVQPSQLERYHVVIFSRPSYSRKLENLLQRCKSLGIVTMADYDDLVFNPDFAGEMPQTMNAQASLGQVTTRLANHQKALLKFNRVSVSTTNLKKHVSAVAADGTDVIQLPNGLSSQWVQYNRARQLRNDHDEVISYLSGSSSHDHDFASVASALSEHLDSHPSHRLEITGRLNYKLHPFRSSQLSYNALLPYEHLPSVMLNGRVTIAPLADTEFNRCKSHIKFIEAAAFGLPTISSAIADFKRHKIPGLLLANNEIEWHKSIKQAMEPDYRASVSEGLIDYAHQHCRNLENTYRLLNFLNLSSVHPYENLASVSGYA